MTRIATIIALFGLTLLLRPTPAHACGPYFARSLLGAGDDALCEAPPLDFDSRLAALAARSVAAIPEPNQLDGEADAEADLRSALLAEGRPANEIDPIVESWLSYREHITDVDAPAFPRDLPDEFAIYLRGARAWHRNDPARAEAWFRALLELPPERRRHRSVWAAYMLGRSASSRCTDADRRFEQTRDLVAEGFVDTIGLGPASWGEQAACWLRSADDVRDIPWARVIELYVQQYAAGDPWAGGSLREVAERALTESIEHPELLERLAATPEARALISGYLAAHPSLAVDRGHAARWLDALEADPSQPSLGAGSLAWIAYQSADMDAAERWARLAPPDDPLARWVAAKLLLRTGSNAEMERAREQLAALERELGPDDVTIRDWRVGLTHAGIGPSAAADEALLAMRADRFVDALAALLRARSWVDAAYVAEQVLTIDELREFVDALPSEHDDLREHAADLRWLLARRLARADRWADALPYYPTELLREAERQHEDLQRADDLRLPAAVRANSLWRAGKRMRELGMELSGTELEPDWRYYEGDYEPAAIGEQRRALELGAELTAPTPDELARARRHFDFDLPRFHYRWRAAALGEQAAALLPDDHEAGARVLCQAAHWIRSRDYRGADRLTRLMIRRNPNIAIARYGEHLLDDPAANACSLDGIDFAAPAFVALAEPVERSNPFARLGALVRRGWPVAIGLALLVLFGLMVMGSRNPPIGPGSRNP